MTLRPKFTFKGLMAPVFTPMNEDESINPRLVPAYADHLHQQGVTGVFVNGTAGEGLSLTLEERKIMAETWMQQRETISTVVLHCSALPLPDVLHLVRHGQSIGATGVTVTPPLFDKPKTVSDLVDYLVEVGRAAHDTPLFYYHTPTRTNVEVDLEDLLREAVKRVPTFAGIKYAAEDVTVEGKACLDLAGKEMTLFSGHDFVLAEALSVGFEAAINGGFNFFPHGRQMFSLASKRSFDEAKDVQVELNSLYNRVIFKQSRGVPAVKAAMTVLTGLDMGPCRKPLKSATLTQLNTLRNELRQGGYNVC